MTLDVVAAAAAFGATPGAQQMRMAWGIVQSNNTDGTAQVRLAGSTTTLTIPYATLAPARPGAKVGVIANGADVAITHIVAPSAIPSARISRRASGQSLANNTQADVTFDTADTDPWGMWNGSSLLTIPVAGTYAVASGLSFASSATGFRNLIIYQNSLAMLYARDSAPQAAGPSNVNGTTIVSCVAGDTIKVAAQQNSGAALNLNASGTAWEEWLSVVWIGWQGPTTVYGPELMENPGAETLDLTGHSSFWGTFTSPTITTTAGEYATGAAGFKNVFSGSGYWVFQGIPLAVRPGDVYKFSVRVKSSVATAATAASSFWLEVITSADSTTLDYFDGVSGASTVISYTATTTSFTTISAEWTVPDGVYWIKPSWRFGHTAAITFYADECSVKQKDLS